MITRFCDICIEKGRYAEGTDFFMSGLYSRKETGYICDKCKHELKQSSQPELPTRLRLTGNKAELV